MRVGWTIPSGMGGALLAWFGLWWPAQALAESVAPPTVNLPTCSWERPGHNPFMGDVVGAVDRYRDIPAESRARLKARMERREYDDLVVIRRDSITGNADYRPTIRDMHFGTRAVCSSVTRASWTPSMQERGLVYCDSGNCILVPTVCRNVSRITRAEVSPDHAEAPLIPGAPDGAVAGAPGSVVQGTSGDTVAGPPGGGVAGVPTSTALSLDGEPSFVTPGEGAPPLGSGGPSGTGIGSPALPAESAGTTVLPPGGVFLPGLGASPPIGFPGASSPIGIPGAAPPVGAVTPFVPTPVPEPQTWGLMLSGLAALAWLRRREKSVARRAAAQTG